MAPAIVIGSRDVTPYRYDSAMLDAASAAGTPTATPAVASSRYPVFSRNPVIRDAIFCVPAAPARDRREEFRADVQSARAQRA